MEKELLTLVSDNGQLRARIHEISVGSYRVDVERLVSAEDAGGIKRGEFWSVITGLTSYTDDENQAKALANENLRCGTEVTN